MLAVNCPPEKLFQTVTFLSWEQEPGQSVGSNRQVRVFGELYRETFAAVIAAAVADKLPPAKHFISLENEIGTTHPITGNHNVTFNFD